TITAIVAAVERWRSLLLQSVSPRNSVNAAQKLIHAERDSVATSAAIPRIEEIKNQRRIIRPERKRNPAMVSGMRTAKKIPKIFGWTKNAPGRQTSIPLRDVAASVLVTSAD